MARNTLSFFSRLFSAKKKSILEKREKKKFTDTSEISQDQEKNVSYETPRNNKNQGFNKTIVIANEEDNIEINNETISACPENTFESTVYISDNLSRGLSHTNVDNLSISASTTRYAERTISEETKASNEFHRGETLSHKHDTYGAGVVNNDVSKDDELEHDSMVLLSKLEQLMIKISDTSVQKSIPLVLESLVQMVNHVVEFAEHLPNSEQKKMTLARLLSRDEQNYKILNSNYIDNERLVVETKSIMNCSNAKQIFTDLSNDLLRLVNVYLSASVKAFGSNHVSEQWKTLYTGFFVNLTKSVRNSQSNQ